MHSTRLFAYSAEQELGMHTLTRQISELSLLLEQMTNANVTAEQHSKYSNRKHC